MMMNEEAVVVGGDDGGACASASSSSMLWTMMISTAPPVLGGGGEGGGALAIVFVVFGCCCMVVVVVFLLMLLLRWFLRYLERKKPLEQIPMAPCCHWLGGHVSTFTQDDFQAALQVLMKDSANKDGQTGFWLGNLPCVSVTHWKDARTILRVAHSRSPFPLLAHHAKMFNGDKSFLVLNGNEWKFHRTCVGRMFGSGSGSGSAGAGTGAGGSGPDALGQAKKAILDKTQTLVMSLKNKLLQSGTTTTATTTTTTSTPTHGGDEAKSSSSIQVDVELLMKMITIDVFGQAALSEDMECCKTLQLSPIARALEFMSRELSRRLADPFNPANYFYRYPNDNNREYKKHRQLLRSFLSTTILRRKEQQQQQQQQQQEGRSNQNGPTPTQPQQQPPQEKKDNNNNNNSCPQQSQDFLSKLLQSYEENIQKKKKKKKKNNNDSDDDDISVSNNDITDIINSLFTAGYTTTSITLTYALYLVSQHPQVEKCVLDEAQALHSSSSSSSSSSEELPYCKAVIRETVRLFPPAPVTYRTITEPIRLSNGNIVIPKNMTVFVPIWLIHRDETNFPSPSEFRPDRWVKYDPKTNRWVDRNDTSSSSSSLSSAETTTNTQQQQHNNHHHQEKTSHPKNEKTTTTTAAAVTNSLDSTSAATTTTTTTTTTTPPPPPPPPTTTTTTMPMIPAANRNAMFGFSSGIRSCVGQKFAMLETSNILAGMIKEFKFTTLPGYKLSSLQNGIVQHPDKGLPMIVELR